MQKCWLLPASYDHHAWCMYACCMHTLDCTVHTACSFMSRNTESSRHIPARMSTHTHLPHLPDGPGSTGQTKLISLLRHSFTYVTRVQQVPWQSCDRRSDHSLCVPLAQTYICAHSVIFANVLCVWPACKWWELRYAPCVFWVLTLYVRVFEQLDRFHLDFSNVRDYGDL